MELKRGGVCMNSEILELRNGLLLAENDILRKLFESYKKLYEKARWDLYTLKLENIALKRKSQDKNVQVIITKNGNTP